MAYNVFHRNIISCHDESFPLVRLSRKCARDKVWITRGIKKVLIQKIIYIKNGYVVTIQWMNIDIKNILNIIRKLLLLHRQHIIEIHLMYESTILSNSG